KYNSLLKPVYSYLQIIQEDLNTVENIYSENSIILFHESFFDHVDNSFKNDSLEIRNKLINWCFDNNIPIIQFSGSNNSRSKNGYNVSLPVKILYQNLELFINSINRGDDL